MDSKKIIPDLFKNDPDFSKAWDAGWSAIHDTIEQTDYHPTLFNRHFYCDEISKKALAYAQGDTAKRAVTLYMLAEPALSHMSLAGITREFGMDVAKIYSEIQNLTSLRFSNTLLGVDLSSVSPLTREALEASRDRSLFGKSFAAAGTAAPQPRTSSVTSPAPAGAPRVLLH